MSSLFTQVFVSVHQIIRDHVLHALLGTAMLLLVPAFSLFSMRQKQELAMTLCLSATSLLLLVFTVLLVASSIWRDIEKIHLFVSGDAVAAFLFSPRLSLPLDSLPPL